MAAAAPTPSLRPCPLPRISPPRPTISCSWRWPRPPSISGSPTSCRPACPPPMSRRCETRSWGSSRTMASGTMPGSWASRSTPPRPARSSRTSYDRLTAPRRRSSTAWSPCRAGATRCAWRTGRRHAAAARASGARAINQAGRNRMLSISRRSWIARASALAASAALPMRPATAADFYDGKILHFLVGIPPGGSYDLMPRFLASHIAKYIPGNPKIVVENMPGAGSLTMMNYLYYKAPHDGTVIGFPMNTMLLEPSLGLVGGGAGGSHFDLSRMAWVGTPGQDPSVAWIAGDSPVRTFEDLRTRGATFGTSNAGADGTVLANLCNKLLGTKIKIVSGYAGTAEYVGAFEKGEVDGAVTLYAALMASHSDWIKSGRIRLLAQFGTERSPELPDIPTGVELATND